MTNLDKLAQTLVEPIPDRGTSPYETNATVIRLEDGMAWVKIPGGVEETPAVLAVAALPGDEVRVRVTGGKAYITGNPSAPPTDDALAEKAQANALRATEAAMNAMQQAEVAHDAADNAVASANTAKTAADSAVADAAEAKEAAEAVEGIAQQAQEDAGVAKASAANASEYAARALGNLSTVQSVTETLNWITAHGTMTLTEDYKASLDTEVVEAKKYYTRSGSGTSADPYVFTLVANPTGNPSANGYYEGALDPTHVYFVRDVDGDYEVGEYAYSVVTEPDVQYISTYYVLSIDESLNNYVGTHLAVTSEGLCLIPDSGGNKVLIATGGQGHTYDTAGTYIIGTDGSLSDVVLAKFTASGAQMGLDGESHLEMDYHSMILVDKEGDPYFYISDLRNKNDNWQATLTETFIGDGEKTLFPVSFGVTSAVSAVDSSDETNYATYRGMEYTFVRPPADGATVTIVYKTTSPNAKAYTIGARTGASGAYSVAEGKNTVASGSMSHAEGQESKAKGAASHAEGVMTEATGMYSHAEGGNAKSKGYCSHAEGEDTEASGRGSHAEGFWLTASGKYSHAEGSKTTASGDYSHAQNQNTTAGYEAQTTIGKYNDNRADTAFEIGNGTIGNPANAFVVDWKGGVELYLDHNGTASTDATSGTDKNLFNAIRALGWYSDVIV